MILRYSLVVIVRAVLQVTLFTDLQALRRAPGRDASRGRVRRGDRGADPGGGGRVRGGAAERPAAPRPDRASPPWPSPSPATPSAPRAARSCGPPGGSRSGSSPLGSAVGVLLYAALSQLLGQPTLADPRLGEIVGIVAGVNAVLGAPDPCHLPLGGARHPAIWPAHLMDTDSNHVRLSASASWRCRCSSSCSCGSGSCRASTVSEFEVASASNRLRVIHEEGPRGRILDRNGSRPRRQPDLDHGGARPGAAAQDDAPRSGRRGSSTWRTRSPTSACRSRPNHIQKRYDDKRYSPQQSVPLADDVSEERRDLPVRARRPSSRAWSSSAARSAPTRTARWLSHLRRLRRRDQRQGAGRTGRRDRDALVDAAATTTTTTRSPRTAQPSTRTTNSVTRSGRAVSSGPPRTTLRAVPGERTIEVNARGDLVDVVSRTKPKAGDDVWLTIDLDVQAYAEQLLQAKIEALRGQTDKDGKPLNAPAGLGRHPGPPERPGHRHGVVPRLRPVDPRQRHVDGVVEAAHRRQCSGLPLNNWAMQGTYAPGSTFKLFTRDGRPPSPVSSAPATRPTSTTASTSSSPARARSASSATPAGPATDGSTSPGRSPCRRTSTTTGSASRSG